MTKRIKVRLFVLLSVTVTMITILDFYLEQKASRQISKEIGQRMQQVISLTWLHQVHQKLGSEKLINSSVFMLTGENEQLNSSDQRTESKQSAVTPFVILSYFRSGSSLTSDSLQHDPRTFFVFEPMHALDKLLTDNKTEIKTLEGEIISISRRTFYGRAINVTNSYLTCDFRTLDVDTASHLFNFFSHRYSDFLQCVESNKTTLGRDTAVHICLPLLSRACLKSSFRFLKIMRVPMKHFMNLMYKFKNMKILHVIRDPRATFYSWSTLGVNMFSNVRKKAQYICNYILKEIETFEIFQKLFPGRVKRLYYEDLARNPVETVEKLYSYMGLNFTDKIAYHIRYITSMGVKDGCRTCVLRGNSTYHIAKWKRNLSDTHVQIIDDTCRQLYDKTGYK